MNREARDAFLRIAECIEAGYLPLAAMPRMAYFGHDFKILTTDIEYWCVYCGTKGKEHREDCCDASEIFDIYYETIEWTCKTCGHKWIGEDGTFCESCGHDFPQWRNEPCKPLRYFVPAELWQRADHAEI